MGNENTRQLLEAIIKFIIRKFFEYVTNYRK